MKSLSGSDCGGYGMKDSGTYTLVYCCLVGGLCSLLLTGVGAGRE